MAGGESSRNQQGACGRSGNHLCFRATMSRGQAALLPCIPAFSPGGAPSLGRCPMATGSWLMCVLLAVVLAGCGNPIYWTRADATLEVFLADHEPCFDAAYV